MKLELTRIDPLRTANVCAAVYALLLGVFALIAIPIIVLVLLFSQEPGEGSSVVALVAVVVAYPILGLIMGWIGGLIGAAIYNLVIRFTGGMKLEFREDSPQTIPAQPLG